MANTIAFKLYYNDGRELQLDRDVTYGNMPRDGLVAVEVLKNENLIFQLHLEPDQKLIYRRRVQLKQGGAEPFVVYILGWRKNVAGQDVQSINFIYEDSDIIQQLPRFREDHVLFCKPEFMKEEE